MIEKRRRQAAITRLVREQAIANQTQLVAFVRANGFEATQASISRDVRELGLVKLKGRYLPLDGVASQAAEATRSPYSELVIGFEPIGAHLIVVRTRTGAANSVAVALDQQAMPELAGTIAGDDTIFLAVRSRSDQGRMIAHLRTWTGFNRTVRRPGESPAGGFDGTGAARTRRVT